MIYQKRNPAASFNPVPTLLGRWCILVLMMHFSFNDAFYSWNFTNSHWGSRCEDKFLSQVTCFGEPTPRLWKCWTKSHSMSSCYLAVYLGGGNKCFTQTKYVLFATVILMCITVKFGLILHRKWHSCQCNFSTSLHSQDMAHLYEHIRHPKQALPKSLGYQDDSNAPLGQAS